MATARDTVKKSLVRIGIIDPTQTPSAGMSEDGLDLLNYMLEEWKNNDILDSHTTYTLDSTVSLDVGGTADITADQAVFANLTKRIADHYQRSVPPQVISEARRGFASIWAQRRAVTGLKVALDKTLTNMPSQNLT